MFTAVDTHLYDPGKEGWWTQYHGRGRRGTVETPPKHFHMKIL